MSAFEQAVVDSVQAGSAVNVVLDGALLTGVPCFVGYRNRQPGDKVTVCRTDAGLVVLGPVGADPGPEPVMPELPPPVQVGWGDGPPAGEGWERVQDATVAVAGLWVRDDGDGATSTYYQRRLEQQAQPAPSRPKPKTSPVASDAWSAYRGGREDIGGAGGGPRQSSYASSLGDWSGAWLWTGLAAPDGATGLRLRLERSPASNGIGGGARVRLYLSNANDLPGRPPSRFELWSPGTLARGQAATWTVPAAWFDHIRARTDVVIVCHATAEAESIIYRPNATLQYLT